MKRIRYFSVLAAGAVLSAGISVAQSSAQGSASTSQNSSAPAGQSSTQVQQQAGASTAVQTNSPVQAGSIIYAELNKSLDAKKAKQGDEVVAKASQAVLSQGKVVVPKGSKIVGHVTQAQAHTKEQQHSELGIAFDHAVLKDGSQVPLAVTVQAIGSSSGGAAAGQGMDADTGMASPGGAGSRPGYGSSGATGGGTMGTRPAAGSVANAAGGAAGTVSDTTGSVTGAAGQTAQAAHLGAGSHGVVGLSGLSLAASTSGSQGAVITSDSKNVKLDSGTELILKAQ